MAGRKRKKIYRNIEFRWKVGVYTRLSREDGDKEESNSIGNQRDLITNYLKKEKDVKIVDYYVDDGFTGTNFKRPGFRRLFDDIVTGKINTVIVKDLSRFGRNYIEVGNYLEYTFPLYNIRFIAINDKVDSFKDPESVSNALIPLKNLFNEEYARDISKKVRSYYETTAQKGKFASGTPPYGYSRDTNDIHQLVINEDEAKNVRLIFKMALQGMGKIKICKYLNDNKILCRKELQRREKYHLSLDPDAEEIIYHWSTSTIGRMLTNEVYIGNSVQNKTTTLNYKIKKIIYKPKDKWAIVENTHEPIIDKLTFEKVQELIKERTSEKKKPASFSIYRGKLKCADCGKAMYRMEDFRGNRNLSNYFCMNYQMNSHDKCTPHKIATSVLDSVILEQIMQQVKLVMNLEKAMEKLKNESIGVNAEKEYLKNVETLNIEIEKCKKEKKKAYENWKFVKITKDEYIEYSKKYDEKIETITKQLEVLEHTYMQTVKELKKDDYWIEHFKRNKKIKVLTRDVINELIDVIYVHENNQLTIKFKYQDEYEQAINMLNIKEADNYD